jgi:hypothetical protein
MKISKDFTVKDLHNYFSNLFPYLKLEVYRGKHEDFQGSPKKDEVSHDRKLSEISVSAADGELVINKEMKVSEFESMMADQYGLNVQVFRKSNDIWLQTSVTDDWTLEKQNGKGERSQLNLYPEQDTEMDMD